jgi:hypothetical protein
MHIFSARSLIHTALLSAMLIGASTITAFAFTEPAGAPPGGNVPAPLNVGGAAQTKTGKLNLFGGGYPDISGGLVNQAVYGLGAYSIAAGNSIYSYGKICAGNGLGDCTGVGGVVINSVGAKVTADQYCFNAGGACLTNAGGGGGLVESDTLQSVTGRGNVTNQWVTTNGLSSTGSDANGYGLGVALGGVWVGGQSNSGYSIYAEHGLAVLGSANINQGLSVGGGGVSIISGGLTVSNGNTTFNTPVNITDSNGLSVTQGPISVHGGLTASKLNNNQYSYIGYNQYGTDALGNPLYAQTTIVQNWPDKYISEVSKPSESTMELRYGISNILLQVDGADPRITTNGRMEAAFIKSTSNQNAALWAPNGGIMVGTNGWKPGGGTWADSSDMRLKKNITPISDALGKIQQLNPVLFDWKNPEEHGGAIHSGGFIAQEVKNVFPQFILTKEAQGADKKLVGPDGSSYALSLPFEFDAYMVAAVKEQEQKVETLENRLDAQQKRIAELEAKIDALSRR